MPLMPVPAIRIQLIQLMKKRMNILNTILTEAPTMYETENDIPLNRRTELNALLNQRLADAVDLQMQMKQAHWNV